MALFNVNDILETITMIQDENLDIRTITMGISLLDCCDSDINRSCRRVYDKITSRARDLVKVGEEIETYIVRVNDVEGYAELSKKRLDAVKVWENIEKAVEEKTILEGTVTEENKGGIVVSVKGVRVFVPASQSGLPRGAELSTMIKEKVKLRITEVNRARRRVVGSIRAVQFEERQAAQAELWNSIEEGIPLGVLPLHDHRQILRPAALAHGDHAPAALVGHTGVHALAVAVEVILAAVGDQVVAVGEASLPGNIG